MSAAVMPATPPAEHESSSSGGEEIAYVSYGGEQHLPLVMSLVDAELSEPYSIFTYRYFVYIWPQLTLLVRFCLLLLKLCGFRVFLMVSCFFRGIRGKGL
jgi:hypothetical protein